MNRLVLKKILCGVLLTFLTSIHFVHAQFTLVAPTDSANTGEIISVPIKVKNFDNIISMQFTVSWDSTLLEFKNTHSYALEEISGNSFGTAATLNGMLAFSWLQGKLEGMSLEDETAIFIIDFQVIGELTTETVIEFTDDIAVIEVVNGNSQEEDVNVENGSIVIGGMTTTIDELEQVALEVHDNYPNPFRYFTELPFTLSRNEEVHVSIWSIDGTKIIEHSRFYTVGKHYLRLERINFPHSGVYYYQIRIRDFTLTKELVIL